MTEEQIQLNIRFNQHRLERWTNRINDLADMKPLLVHNKELEDYDKAIWILKNLAVDIYQRQVYEIQKSEAGG